MIRLSHAEVLTFLDGGHYLKERCGRQWRRSFPRTLHISPEGGGASTGDLKPLTDGFEMLLNDFCSCSLFCRGPWHICLQRHDRGRSFTWLWSKWTGGCFCQVSPPAASCIVLDTHVLIFLCATKSPKLNTVASMRNLRQSCCCPSPKAPMFCHSHSRLPNTWGCWQNQLEKEVSLGILYLSKITIASGVLCKHSETCFWTIWEQTW